VIAAVAWKAYGLVAFLYSGWLLSIYARAFDRRGNAERVARLVRYKQFEAARAVLDDIAEAQSRPWWRELGNALILGAFWPYFMWVMRASLREIAAVYVERARLRLRGK
jgi:hypothetical protein